jgi:hypothetical protein
MQTTGSKSFLTKSLLPIWIFLCAWFYVRYAGSISNIHGSSFEDWASLLFKLHAIDPLNYATTLSISLLEALLFSASSTFAGTFALLWLQRDLKQQTHSTISWFVSFGTAFAIGSGILSIIFLALAELHQLTVLSVGTIMLINFVLGIRPIKQLFISRPPTNRLGSMGLYDWSIFLLTTTIVLVSLLYSTSRLSYDSVAIYFSGAKMIATTQSLQHFIADPFEISSLQSGLQYAALIRVFGDQAARIYSWVNGLIIILFSLALAEEVGLAKRPKLILLTLILSSTAFLDLMGDGKIDLASTVPAIAATYWMVANTRLSSIRIFLLIGFLTGLAMAARPFNIFLLALIIALYYVQTAFLKGKPIHVDTIKFLAVTSLLIGIGIVCLLSYQFIENWIILGNPLASIENYQKLNSSVWQWAFDPKLIWLFRILYPFTVTFANTPQSLGNISPLFLALLPALFFKDIREKVKIPDNLSILIRSSITTLVLWILIFFTVFEIRYVLFLWIILFIPFAIIIEATIESTNPLLRNTTRLVMLFILVFTAIRVVYIAIDTYSPLDKNGNPQCSNFSFCDYLKPINQNAQMGDRVLTFAAFRYYLRSDLFDCSTQNDEYIALQNLSHGHSTAFWAEVYREGYRYVAYENEYSVRHLQLGLIPNPYNTPPWMTLKPLYSKPGDPEVAYQILVNNPPVEVEETCRKTIDGIWEVQSLSNLGK